MKKVIFALIFIAGGIGLIIWGYGIVKKAKASTGWPTVEGTVVSAKVERKKSTSGRRRGSSTTYKAEVVYDYSVEDTPYSSNRISFGEYSSGNPNHARQIVNRYPQGGEVTVYFKPGQPKISVLEPGESWSTYMPLGMGVVFFLMGLIVLFSKNIRIHSTYR